MDDARAERALRHHAGLPAQHWHREARREWAYALADGDDDLADLLTWGLLGLDDADTPGAAFNTALLGLAGQRGVIMDEDVVPLVVPAPTTGRGGAPGDPTALEVFESRSAALNQAEGALRPLRSILTSIPSATVGCFGVLGDSGMRSTAGYLMRDAEWVANRAEGWPTLSTSRNVHRGAPEVSSGALLMSTCLLVDAQQILPPVFPVLRNADGLWGRHLVEAKKTILHLPWSVLHLPGLRRGHADDYLHLAQPRATDLLSLLPVHDLHSLSRAPAEAWRTALRGPWRGHLERMALRMDDARRLAPSSARALHHDLEAGLRAIIQASGVVPSPVDTPGDDPWGALAHQVRLYLGLREVWPEIWDRAQQLPFPRAIAIC